VVGARDHDRALLLRRAHAATRPSSRRGAATASEERLVGVEAPGDLGAIWIVSALDPGTLKPHQRPANEPADSAAGMELAVEESERCFDFSEGGAAVGPKSHGRS
jgi:hypothetical protein